MDALVCPITQDRIRVPVRTLAGIIYEHDAIKAWLDSHSYDPVTRLVLPSKHLLPVNASDVNKSPNEFRVGLIWTICTPLYHMAAEAESKFAPTGLNTVAYSKARLKHLREDPTAFFMRPQESDEIDRQLGLVRTPGTGKHFQCLDLTDTVLTNTDLKCVDFRGSRLHAAVFLRCDFGRCNFSYTDMTKVAFVDCQFRGEQTIFVGAKTSNKTRFRNCIVESHKSWRMTPPDDFAVEMNARGLDVQPHMFF